MAATTPMLLNRRLTLFLSQNTTPTLPTLILLSPTGKLLSSSSPLPASALRTHATMACSLWDLYSSSTPELLQEITNGKVQEEERIGRGRCRGRGSDGSLSDTSTVAEEGEGTSCVTIQLEGGTMVIRALNCGLLFVAIGTPSASASRPHSVHKESAPSSPGVEQSDAGSVTSSGTTMSKGGILGVRRRADEIARWLDGQLLGFALGAGER